MQVANRESFAAAARRGMVPVEYIEGTGTQWIDTGIGPHTSGDETGFQARVECAFTHVPTSMEVICGYQIPASTAGMSGARCVLAGSGYTSPSKWGFGGKVGFVDSSLPISVGSKVEVIAKYSTLITYMRIGPNVLVSQSGKYYWGDASSPARAALFCRNLGSSSLTYSQSFFAHARIYRAQFLDVDDVSIVRADFVPVRVGSVGYVYERESGTLFGNAGTGSFTIGPDK